MCVCGHCPGTRNCPNLNCLADGFWWILMNSKVFLLLHYCLYFVQCSRSTGRTDLIRITDWVLLPLLCFKLISMYSAVLFQPIKYIRLDISSCRSFGVCAGQEALDQQWNQQKMVIWCHSSYLWPRWLTQKLCCELDPSGKPYMLETEVVTELYLVRTVNTLCPSSICLYQWMGKSIHSWQKRCLTGWLLYRSLFRAAGEQLKIETHPPFSFLSFSKYLI